MALLKGKPFPTSYNAFLKLFSAINKGCPPEPVPAPTRDQLPLLDSHAGASIPMNQFSVPTLAEMGYTDDIVQALASSSGLWPRHRTTSPWM